MRLRSPALTFASLALTVSTAYANPFSWTAGSGTLTPRATVCNGHAELCNRSYGNVSFVGTHDSYAIGVNNLAVNQDQTITTQLNDGVRMLQMQAHNENGVIKLCHTLCSLYDGGTLEDYLKTVKSWLDSNPDEVLSLLIVNIDNMPATAFDTVFKAVGLDAISFVPTSQPTPASGWPTLGSMIDNKKRLVTFLDHQANPEAVPYLIDEFSNIWETAFNVVDPAFNCEVNRTAGDTSTQMYLINHFLDKIVFGNPVPYVDKANVTNAASGAGSLGEQVTKCTGQHGRPPNFLLVDFYEYGGGSVFQVAADINGVTYNSANVAKPVPTDGTATSSGGTIKTTTSPIAGSKGNATPLFSSSHLTSLLVVSFVLVIGPFLVL